MKGNKRLNLPLTAAGVLFCLVLISLHLTSGIYARYSTRAVGSDASRIAAFHVAAVPGSDAEQRLELVAGQTEETACYALHIEGDSEVAVVYSVTVDFDDRVTTGQISRVLLDGQAQSFARSVTFSDVGTLAPGAGEEVRLLELDLGPAFAAHVSDGLDFSNDTVNGSSDVCPFTVTVSFRQVN